MEKFVFDLTTFNLHDLHFNFQVKQKTSLLSPTYRICVRGVPGRGDIKAPTLLIINPVEWQLKKKHNGDVKTIGK